MCFLGGSGSVFFGSSNLSYIKLEDVYLFCLLVISKSNI